MADYSALKATIDASINTNGQQAITGAILNDVLNEMVDVLGEGYTFLGVATISTNPTTPEGKAYYLAGAAGTYSNFGNIVVAADEVALLVWNGTAWSKVVTGAASKSEVSRLGQQVADLTPAYLWTDDMEVNSLIKEFYLEGMKADKYYYVYYLCKGNNGQELVYVRECDDAQGTNPVLVVRGVDNDATKGLMRLEQYQGSGVFGYIVKDIVSDAAWQAKTAYINKDIVSNVDFSPRIKEHIDTTSIKDAINIDGVINETFEGATQGSILMRTFLQKGTYHYFADAKYVAIKEDVGTSTYPNIATSDQGGQWVTFTLDHDSKVLFQYLNNVTTDIHIRVIADGLAWEHYQDVNTIEGNINTLDERVDALDSSVESLDARIKTIATEHINLLEGAAMTSGYVYAHATGALQTASGGSIYDDGIPVKSGETLYYKNLYPYFSGLKKSSDNSWVAMSNDTTWNMSGEYVVPADGLLYIAKNNAAPNRQLLTRDETMYDDDIIISYTELNSDLNTGVQRVFHIGSTREYTTLRAGIAEAIQYPRSIVYVDAETFDLTQEFAAEISAAGTTQYGIELGNGVHVIFSAGAVVNALYHGTNANVVKYFAPFYSGIMAGGFTLEGLTIYAKNTRYCVHDEYGGADVKDIRNRYINCKMEYDGTTSPYDYYQNCIGGGTAKHTYAEIINCYFDTYGTMGEKTPVSYHNSVTDGSKSTIILSNCYFAHGTFRLGYYGPSTLMSRAFVNNCSFTSTPFIRAEDASAQVENWEMVAFMNEIRS